MGKYTTQELKNIYFEAKERFSYVEDEDIMGYENIAKKVERVLTGKTKFCKFNIFEKDTISAMFTENDNVCIINETYDEYVNRYGEYADLIIKLYGVKVKSKVEEEPEATAETVESMEETTVSETVEETAEQETELNAEVAEVEAEQTAEPETFSYEFNEVHKITISKRNNVYVEEFFEKMGGSYVKLGEEAWGCIEDIEEYYGIKINRNVQTDTEESESESELEPTVDSNTVETYQDNINVLIVADVINAFETITHTGYFDTS